MDLANRITKAIFMQEGMPKTWNNPGNLRDCPWFDGHYQQRSYPDSTRVVFANGFWIPRTRIEGVAGTLHCVSLCIAEGMSLTDLISKHWAPPSENDTVAYIKNVSLWAGVPDVKVAMWNQIVDPLLVVP